MKYFELYKEKKKQDKNKIYLFKKGIFYNAFGEDALKLSRELDLKLTTHSNVTEKCGFPVSGAGKYLKLMKFLGLEYEIVLSNVDIVLEDIKSLDMDLVMATDALKKLQEYNELLKDE